MSRETRTIRPFDVAPSLERLFSNTKLYFGDLICDSDSRITVGDTNAFGISSAKLKWAENEESAFEAFKVSLANGATDSGLNCALLSLLIFANNSYLKFADLIWEKPLDDIDSLSSSVDLTEGTRPRAFDAVISGATVEVYLVLSKDIQPRPLKPWRKGTWLAKTNFRIQTDHQASLFRPLPLDSEARKRLNLPKGTVRYVHMNDHDLTAPYEDTDPPEFYLDNDLLSELGVHSRSSVGRYIQMQLIVDFVSAVVMEFARNPKASEYSYQDLEESLIGRVVRLLSGPKSTDDKRNNYISLMRTNPGKIVAEAEDSINLRKEILDSIRGEQL